MNHLAVKGDKKYSFAEYMKMEETSEERHDFYHGEIFAWQELLLRITKYAKI